MRRANSVLLSAGVALVVVSAVVYAAQAPGAQAVFGPGRLHRPGIGTGPTPTPTPPLCLQSYPVVTLSSPSPSNGQQASDQLNGVIALSATNVWAVGSSNNDAQGLIERYDGTSWSIVASPTPSGSISNALYGIAAVSANDIWAVGQTTHNNGTANPSPQPLIEHWNGTAWSLITNPTIPGTIYRQFAVRAVTALASNDVWAVGSAYFPSTGPQMVVEHWNGSQWSVLPDAVEGAGLNSLVVLSDTNVWAVGIGPSSNSALNATTLIEHYDGIRWSVVTSPSPGTVYNTLTGVAATSPTNIWAVGSYSDFNEEPFHNLTVVEHYNGIAWSIVASPNPGSLNDVFQAVGIDSVGNVWAAGEYQNDNAPRQALVEHLGSPRFGSGATWTRETAPPRDAEGDNDFEVNAMSVLSAASVWFAGDDHNDGIQPWSRTLVAQYRRRVLAIPCHRP